MSAMEEMEPVRAGITGCGGITPTVLRGIKGIPEIDVRIVHDIDDFAVRQVASEFTVPRYTTDFDDFLSENIELVVVNTPNDCHRDQAVQAVKSGKHCLVQKPLARNVEEGMEMVAAAKDAGRLLGVVMLERSDPIYRQMRAMAADGCFGSLTVVRTALAHVNHLRRPPAPDDWRSSPERIGGGSFIQLAVHHIDIAQFILDQNIVEVTALSSSMVAPKKFPVDETTATVVRFSEGTIGLFLSSFTASTDSVEFFGTDGMISRDDSGVRWLAGKLFSGELWDSRRVGEMHELEMPKLATKILELIPRYEPHRLFAHAIRGKAPLETPGEVGLQALKVVEAVRKSSMEKRAIIVE